MRLACTTTVAPVACLISVLVAISCMARSSAFCITPQSGRICSGTAVAVQATSLLVEEVSRPGISHLLAMILQKPSKTLSVILDTDVTDFNPSDIAIRSMQLRKIGASALATKNLDVAQEYVKEQSTAQGNFPGACPIIYISDGDLGNIDSAIIAGVSAISVPASLSNDAVEAIYAKDISLIYKVETPDEVLAIATGVEHGVLAFQVSSESDKIEEILRAIPNGSVVIATIASMQPNNIEIEKAKSLQKLTASNSSMVHSILMEQAVVGDNEDLEYSSFVISGVTKKKSSTFRMTGLTGSTNGHFGGVESKTSTTWLRQKRQQL